MDVDFLVGRILFVLAFFFGILQFVGLVLALIDLLRREDHQVVGNSRVIWVLIILFVPLAWIVYFVAGRR